jgi:opacity protein-like surface antigen
MKSLRYLAVLPLMAAASQALTLDVQLGAASPSGYSSNSFAGLGIGSQLSDNFHLGLNLTSKKLEDSFTAVNIKAYSAMIDLTYELNGAGGIHPFIGAGVGNTWLSGGEPGTDKNALTMNAFAGMRFTLSEVTDVLLMVRSTSMTNVTIIDRYGTHKDSISSWEYVAGLRFKF